MQQAYMPCKVCRQVLQLVGAKHHKVRVALSETLGTVRRPFLECMQPLCGTLPQTGIASTVCTIVATLCHCHLRHS